MDTYPPSDAALLPHSSHWGAFSVRRGVSGIEIVPHPRDPAPSPLLGNLPAALTHRARIARPAVRRGWLDHGPGADRRRGRGDFIAVPGDEALDRVAGEVAPRLCRRTCCVAVFAGGSYLGWSTPAAVFHHAQGQVHRFLNMAGGYVRSVNSYSSGAAIVILPHVLGPQEAASRNNVGWDELATQTELVLAFGGMALKNNDVGGGGTSQHIARDRLLAARARGAEFHVISPLRDDLVVESSDAAAYPIRPGTDVALMLGMAHTLVSEGRHDRAFIKRYCVGYEIFEDYLLGRSDNRPKDAGWAAEICEVWPPGG